LSRSLRTPQDPKSGVASLAHAGNPRLPLPVETRCTRDKRDRDNETSVQASTHRLTSVKPVNRGSF
jgi:hypothetical protein